MVLFKFGRCEHLQQLRSRGLLHMKPQQDFRKMESDAAREDRFETTDRVFQPNAVKSLTVTSNHSPRKFVIQSEHLVGPVLISLANSSCNIYCMFAVTQNATRPPIDPRNFGFGDSFVAILDTQTFLDRVCSATNSRRFYYELSRVEYYDPENYSGETGPFRKPATHSYQNEFRFIVQPGSCSPIDLEIGSLADITTEVLPVSDSNRLADLFLERANPTV
jgi:hypothetical protein